MADYVGLELSGYTWFTEVETQFGQYIWWHECLKSLRTSVKFPSKQLVFCITSGIAFRMKITETGGPIKHSYSPAVMLTRSYSKWQNDIPSLSEEDWNNLLDEFPKLIISISTMDKLMYIKSRCRVYYASLIQYNMNIFNLPTYCKFHFSSDLILC